MLTEDYWRQSILARPLYLFVGTLLCAALCLFFWVSAQEEREVETGVYRVHNYGGSKTRLQATGTSFKVADPGIVITNYHVIRDARALALVYSEANEVKEMPVKLLWFDRAQDLAILKSRQAIPGAVLTLADISEADLRKKDLVEAIGYPGAADQLASTSTLRNTTIASYADATVSTGTVQRQVPSLVRLTIQHSANVNSGNSGGPLLDSCQRVIGVNTLSKSAELNVGDMVNALKTQGVVNFQTPGSLESAIHVREVIAALRDKNINANISSGRCRAGIDPAEMWAISLTSVLSVAGFALTGFAVLVRGRNGPWRAASSYPEDVFVDDESGPVTELADGYEVGDEVVELVPADGTAPYVISTIGPAFERRGVTIGRRGGGADVMIDDGAISRQHAVLKRHPDGSLVISDLGSTNGTRVDGVAASDTQSCPLHDGSELLFGDRRFTVRIRGHAGGHGQTGWRLSGFDAHGRVFQFDFTTDANIAPTPGSRAPIVTIGRADDNDLMLDDPSVSRHHARLLLTGSGGICVEDLKSSNGTKVNGKPVNKPLFPVASGDKLQFGVLSASLSRKT